MVAACACGLNVGHVCEGLPQTCDCTTRAPSLAENTPIYYIYTYSNIPHLYYYFCYFLFDTFSCSAEYNEQTKSYSSSHFMRKVSFFFGACFYAHFQCREARCAFAVQFLQKNKQQNTSHKTGQKPPIILYMGG